MNSEQREAKRVRDAAYYQAHREERLALQAAYNADHREAIAAYRADRREEARARHAANYAAHKEERSAYGAAYYKDHKAERLAYSDTYKAAHREDLRGKDVMKQQRFLGNLRTLKAAQCCDDCGTSEGVLDYHHTDPTMKRYTVSEMCNNSLEAFVDEVAKCTVQCRSCHQKRHVAMRAA